MSAARPILAVCGKGGVGKTVVSALLARALLDAGVKPLLLIDADPVGGLCSAIGERPDKTLGQARAEVIAAARGADGAARDRLAQDLDYYVMEALLEREGYALLAMGQSEERGCFCPANALLREAIDLLAEPFKAVLIDAEAGVEQIRRQVTRRVTRVLAVTDGSARGAETLRQIAALVGHENVAVVCNRDAGEGAAPEGFAVAGVMPENAELNRFDREGRSLWELPEDNPARVAAREIAGTLGGE